MKESKTKIRAVSLMGVGIAAAVSMTACGSSHGSSTKTYVDNNKQFDDFIVMTVNGNHVTYRQQTCPDPTTTVHLATTHGTMTTNRTTVVWDSHSWIGSTTPITIAGNRAVVQTAGGERDFTLTNNPPTDLRKFFCHD